MGGSAYWDRDCVRPAAGSRSTAVRSVASRLSRIAPVRPRQFPISRTPVGSVRTIRRLPSRTATSAEPPRSAPARRRDIGRSRPSPARRRVRAACATRSPGRGRAHARRLRRQAGRASAGAEAKLEQQRRAQKCRVARCLRRIMQRAPRARTDSNTRYAAIGGLPCLPHRMHEKCIGAAACPGMRRARRWLRSRRPRAGHQEAGRTI